MANDDPEGNDPLSPYSPAEVPNVPGNGRRWFALLLTAVLTLGAVYGVLSLVLPL